MEQKKEQEVSSVYCDRFPCLSAKYPWFIVQNMEEDMDDQIFSTLQNPSFKYECRIPDLLGGRIRGCFHGWLVLSNHPRNNRWSLYNPHTSKVISLPLLNLQEGDYQYIGECCLSAPPDDPNSVVLLTITDTPTFVSCPPSPKRKKPRWTKMSYSNQLKKLTCNDKLLYSLTSCNGKIYALSTDSYIGNSFIEVDIVVKAREVVIKLLLFGRCPEHPSHRCSDLIHFLKGSCSELFYIVVGFHDETKTTIEFHEETKTTVGDVYLFKADVTSINWEGLKGLKDWDMTGKKYYYPLPKDYNQDLNNSMLLWEKVQDLKNAIFFLDLHDNSIFYNPAIASEFGGFVHILDKMDNVIHSYHVNYQTIVPYPIAIPSLLLPASHVSIWECRLQDDHGEAKPRVDVKKEEDEIVVTSVTNDKVGFDESDLLSLPFGVLAILMEFFVGVDYMNIRATCKRCHLAAPPIHWRCQTAFKRLQDDSFTSPCWLMALQEHRGVITFKDPLLGDTYYMKNSQITVYNEKIYCSRFGWLVLKMRDSRLVFFNPFTNDLRELPNLNVHLESLCFSAPPTSPDCMVVGVESEWQWRVYIHFVARDPKWRMLDLIDLLRFRPSCLSFPTFIGQDFYALTTCRTLIVLKNVGKDWSWEISRVLHPRMPDDAVGQYFLVRCDQQVLLVTMGGIGDPIEIFKLNDESNWEKINGIGKHMIYICETTCLCIEAKMPEMENKIFLPQVCSANGKIVFYSLETCTFHTFNGKNLQQDVRDISDATHLLSAHAWIEPSWS